MESEKLVKVISGSMPIYDTKVATFNTQHRVGGVSKDPSLLSGAIETGKYVRAYPVKVRG